MNKRPKVYRYFDLLKQHLNGDLSKIFSGELVYPRQLEIHLPGDGKTACNFGCYYCQAKKLEKRLVRFEQTALSLVNKLEGRIPWITIGGQYTEPLLNPYLFHFIKAIKRQGSYYGIHTNGSLFGFLDTKNDFLTKLCEESDSVNDFVTCSLDAGFPESHMRIKGLKNNWFNSVVFGLARLIETREGRNFPSVRVTYLMNEQNSSPDEVKSVISIMRNTGIDSLRFSIPYDYYGNSLGKTREYKKKIELRYEQKYHDLVSPYLSSNSEKPYIYWMPPEYQDVDSMDYKVCIDGYYQICLGADGWFYRCTSAAATDFKACRLGKATDNLAEFETIIRKNQSQGWSPSICLNLGVRCSRMALEINSRWNGKNV